VNDIVVTIDGTKVAPLAGPGQLNWTYQATLMRLSSISIPTKVGAQITVQQYPIGCK